MKTFSVRTSTSLIVIYLIAFSLGLEWTFVSSIGNILTSNNCDRLSPIQYGSLPFILVVGAIVISNIVAFLGRRHGMKKILLFGITCAFFSMTLFGLSNKFFIQSNFEYGFLFFSQFVLGICIGSLLTALNVYVVFLCKKFTASALVALYACMGLGSASIPLFLQLLPNMCSWSDIPLSIACIAAFLFLLAIWIVPEMQRSYPINKVNFGTFWDAKKTRLFQFALIVILFGICESAFDYWGTIYLHHSKGVDIVEANYGLTMFWGMSTLGQVVISALSIKISPTRIYYTLSLLIAVSMFGFSLGKHFNIGILPYVVGGLGCSAFFSLSINFAEKEFGRIIEIVSGMLVTGYFVGVGLGSLIIGLTYQMKNFNPANVYFSLGIVALVILGLSRRLLVAKLK